MTPATIAADDSELTRVANIRANEMADHGSLRYQGKKEGKHKRPDGFVGQLLMIQSSQTNKCNDRKRQQKQLMFGILL